MPEKTQRVFTEEDVRNVFIYLDIKNFTDWQIQQATFWLNNRKRIGKGAIARPRRKH
jgi:hypothetical protein